MAKSLVDINNLTPQQKKNYEIYQQKQREKKPIIDHFMKLNLGSSKPTDENK